MRINPMPVPHLTSMEEGNQQPAGPPPYNKNADLEKGPQPPAQTYQKPQAEQDFGGYPMDNNRYAFETRDTIDSRKQMLMAKQRTMWQKVLAAAVLFAVLVALAFGISRAVNAI